MSREKQIEEVRDIMLACGVSFRTPYKEIANKLYEAGYRKQSEVASEIFEEIQKIIVRRILHNGNYSFEGVIDSITNYLDELKKKYTEEQNGSQALS